MFEVQLFLGFPVDKLFLKRLEGVNPNIVSQFIQEGDDYLRKVEHKEISFFGKSLGKKTTMQQLEMLENNIYSLLRKLVPDFPYNETPLYLFPIEHE